MSVFTRWSQEHRDLLGEVLHIAQDKGVSLYLVGGVIRDILSERKKEILDLDFCLAKGAIPFAHTVAKKMGAGFVVLDRAHGCARVVRKMGPKVFTLDFTDFRGKTLADDLAHRDFTVNSMAIALTPELLCGGKNSAILIDPLAGRADLRKKLVRMVHAQSFDEDPLRILRAFSIAALFDMRITPQTSASIRKKRKRLGVVSMERIRDEFVKILSSPRAYEAFLQLEDHKILDVLLPELKPMRNLSQGPYHHLDVWKHTLETCRQLEAILTKVRRTPALEAYLDEEVSSGRKRYSLIKLAGLLHDIGKPKTLRIKKAKVSFHGHERVGAKMARTIAQRMKFSNDEVNALHSMIMAHLRPGFLSDIPRLSPRAKFRFFRDTATWAASVLLISLADQRATKGRLATPESRLRHEKLVRMLLKEYFRSLKEKKIKRLVNGDQLMKRLSLPPSPLIGRILKELDEAQAIGAIKTKEEAFAEAKKFVKNA